MAIGAHLMTAEEFQQLDDERQLELERGELLVMNRPGLRHGYVSGKTLRIIGDFVEKHKLGRVFGNDSGVVTERGPDTVRGPDVMYYSFQRLPADQLPAGYADVAPELVFEVLSPDDRPSRVLRKIREYLTAGVLCVVILDPEMQWISLHRKGELAIDLTREDELTLPELSASFQKPVLKFFT